MKKLNKKAQMDLEYWLNPVAWIVTIIFVVITGLIIFKGSLPSEFFTRGKKIALIILCIPCYYAVINFKLNQ